MSRRAAAALLVVLLCAAPCGAEAVKFRLFDWLTGNDAALHQKLTEFFKLDAAKLPTLTPIPRGFKLENPGGAPSAIAWGPLDQPDPGLYTLRFEARWEGEGQHGRAAASFATERLDFEPTRAWTAYAVSMRQAGASGPSSVSFSMRGRHGALEIRDVELLRVPFDVRLFNDPSWLKLQIIGRAPADALLEWRTSSKNGQFKLADLKWTEDGGVASATLPLPGGTIYDWTLTRDGKIIVVGNRVRIGLPPAVGRGPMPYPVTIREDGTMLVDGRPFLPMGLYLHESSVEAVDQAAKAGLNLVLVSGNADAVKAVEAARARGMQAIVETGVSADPAKMEAEMRAIVDRFGKLQVMAWTAVDEPDLKPSYTMPVLEALHAGLAQLDGRPLYQANHSPQSFWTSGTACDILAVDPYPLSAVPRPLTTVGRWIDEARAAIGPGKSVWLVAQAFVEAPFWPTPPTPDQLRAMTWIALNHGARGIAFYTVHEVLDPASPPSFNWDLRKTPLWDEIQKEAADVRALEPFLLRAGGPRGLPSLGSFDAAMWEDGKGNFLIAVVNVGNEAAEAVLGLPIPGMHDLHVAPNGPEIAAKDGKIAVRLAPYGVLLLTGKSKK